MIWWPGFIDHRSLSNTVAIKGVALICVVLLAAEASTLIYQHPNQQWRPSRYPSQPHRYTFDFGQQNTQPRRPNTPLYPRDDVRQPEVNSRLNGPRFTSLSSSARDDYVKQLAAYRWGDALPPADQRRPSSSDQVTDAYEATRVSDDDVKQTSDGLRGSKHRTSPGPATFTGFRGGGWRGDRTGWQPSRWESVSANDHVMKPSNLIGQEGSNLSRVMNGRPISTPYASPRVSSNTHVIGQSAGSKNKGGQFGVAGQTRTTQIPRQRTLDTWLQKVTETRRQPSLGKALEWYLIDPDRMQNTELRTGGPYQQFPSSKGSGGDRSVKPNGFTTVKGNRLPDMMVGSNEAKEFVDERLMGEPNVLLPNEPNVKFLDEELAAKAFRLNNTKQTNTSKPFRMKLVKGNVNRRCKEIDDILFKAINDYLRPRLSNSEWHKQKVGFLKALNLDIENRTNITAFACKIARVRNLRQLSEVLGLNHKLLRKYVRTWRKALMRNGGVSGLQNSYTHVQHLLPKLHNQSVKRGDSSLLNAISEAKIQTKIPHEVYFGIVGNL